MPRAELTAIIQVLEVTNGNINIISDCKHGVVIYNEGKHLCSISYKNTIYGSNRLKLLEDAPAILRLSGALYA